MPRKALDKGGRTIIRVWLHRSEGDEQGWSASCLDYLGFATWAPSRTEVLERVPAKLREYQRWLAGYGIVVPVDSPSIVQVVEETSGDEVAFREDLLPASTEEISQCARLLECTRADILRTAEPLPDDLLDWDPPYRHFASWAWWRTIRQILEHIALTEVGYYLPSVGWQSSFDPATLKGIEWRDQLRRSRTETQRFLEELKSSPGRTRVSRRRLPDGEETWSVRKVLRRLVSHERLHWKSIRRIARDYGQRS